MATPLQRLSQIVPKPQNLLLPNNALRRVTSKSGLGVYASCDRLYAGAVFGRDSLEVAEDLIYIRPKLVRTVLLTLASLQGTVENGQNEEQVGKIIHEYRRRVVDGKPITGVRLDIFKELANKWGGSKYEVAYYGSVDATPHFLRVLGEFCAIHGDDILLQTVMCRDQQKRTVHAVAKRALAWLERQLYGSETGLLEFHRLSPHGILNQVWKDSDEFYIHENKAPVNHKRPIASVEVQALVVDALRASAAIFPTRAMPLLQRAKQVRDETIRLLWLADRRYFALGYDYRPSGSRRIITTPTANPGALLDSSFLDDLPTERYEETVGGLIHRLMSHDFLTDAGLRSRALSASSLIDFWDYHGSYVSWPKETYDIARGMRRHGFGRLAYQLENRILNVVQRSRGYPEFVFVDGWGRVFTGAPSLHRHGELTLVESSNQPERIQAWTVSAVMSITARRLSVPGSSHRSIPPFVKDLQQTILQDIPRINRHLNPFALQARYPRYPYKLRK